MTDVTGNQRATSDRTVLSPELLAADAVAFGLRMNEGISLPGLRRRFPNPLWDRLLDLVPRLLLDGLITDSPEGRIKLSRRGRLLADAVGSEVIAAFAAETVSP
jgi:oxygen-independent coproporphyrinogen-3 oxidase